MKLESVHLQHVFNHEDTEFTFPDDPLIAFVGDSGSGKTSLIESIPLSIYGRCPSRNSNVFQAATRGFRGDCSVETVFANEKQEIKIVRSWVQEDATSGSNHSVFVFQKKNDDPDWGESLTSGKIADSKKVLDKSFPPYEIFLTTNFSDQTGISLLSASQEERREILGNLLAPLLFAEFDALFEKSKDNRKQEEKRNEKVKHQLIFLQDQAEKFKQQPKLIEGLQKNVETEEVKLSKFEDLILSITEKANILKEKISKTEFQIQTRNKLEKEIQTEDNRFQEVEKEIDSYTEEEFDPSQLEVLETQKKEYAELQKELTVIQTIQVEAERELSKIEKKKIKVFSMLDHFRKSAKILETVPCDEELQKQCPFVKNALNAKIEIPKQAKELDSISELQEGQEAEIAKIEQQLTILKGKTAQFKELEKKERFLLNLKQKIELQKVNHESLLREKGQLSGRIEKLNVELTGIVIDENVKLYPLQLEKLRKEWTKVQDTIQEIQKCLKQLRRTLTIAESAKQKQEELGSEIEDVKREIIISEAEMSIWGILEEGFSRRGAQTLLLKQELDMFENIVQRYLDIVFLETGKDIKLFFETETALKSRADFKESLIIRCVMNGKELLASELSGGEIQGVGIALRAGLLYYNMVKNNNDLHFAIFDEVTSATDERISLNVLGVFEDLGKIFPEVIISTYDPDLLKTARTFQIKEVDGVAKIE